MKTFELIPTRNKSYYGKAKVIQVNENLIQLQSYNTIVCEIDNGKFKRLWSGYSATTMKHINDFLNLYNIDGGGKSWWTQQPVEN
jgi:hypothetical protein